MKSFLGNFFPVTPVPTDKCFRHDRKQKTINSFFDFLVFRESSHVINVVPVFAAGGKIWSHLSPGNSIQLRCKSQKANADLLRVSGWFKNGQKLQNDGEEFNRLKLFSGQSYKHFTIVNYNSRVIIWGIFQSRTTL